MRDAATMNRLAESDAELACGEYASLLISVGLPGRGVRGLAGPGLGWVFAAMRAADGQLEVHPLVPGRPLAYSGCAVMRAFHDRGS